MSVTAFEMKWVMGKTGCVMYLPATVNKTLFFKGDHKLLDAPIISVIGTRTPTALGVLRAAKVAKELVSRGFVVMSGLAAGIDTAVHQAALEAGGKTIAVIGTSLNLAYPKENAALQAQIGKDHLLVTEYTTDTFDLTQFPARNKLMAQLSLASILVEANDQSGTKHQAHACTELKRPFYVLKSQYESGIEWTKVLVDTKAAILLQSMDDIKVQ